MIAKLFKEVIVRLFIVADVYVLTVWFTLWLLHVDSLKFKNVFLIHIPKVILLIWVELLEDAIVQFIKEVFVRATSTILFTNNPTCKRLKSLQILLSEHLLLLFNPNRMLCLSNKFDIKAVDLLVETFEQVSYWKCTLLLLIQDLKHVIDGFLV